MKSKALEKQPVINSIIGGHSAVISFSRFQDHLRALLSQRFHFKTNKREMGLIGRIDELAVMVLDSELQKMAADSANSKRQTMRG